MLILRNRCSYADSIQTTAGVDIHLCTHVQHIVHVHVQALLALLALLALCAETLLKRDGNHISIRIVTRCHYRCTNGVKLPFYCMLERIFQTQSIVLIKFHRRLKLIIIRVVFGREKNLANY